MAKITDDDIGRLLDSDPEQALRLIIDKYGSRLYWHIRRMVIIHDDADDALQNVFISAWKSLGSFRNESSLYTWLYKIATNEALTVLRKRQKNVTVPLDDLELFFSSSPEGDTFFDGDEAERVLQNAILKLPEKQQLVFNMKYYDDMSYEDISKTLGTSVGALKASYHFAVRKIEEYIRKRLNF